MRRRGLHWGVERSEACFYDKGRSWPCQAIVLLICGKMFRIDLLALLSRVRWWIQGNRICFIV
jgi:hypothetical protein